MPESQTASSLPGGPESGLSSLTYEAARDALGQVVRALETGGTSLEESLTLWERGETLATICQERLDGVRARLEARRPSREAVADSESEPF